MFSKPAQSPDDAWKSTVLEKLVFSALKEQKATRRWGIFFKLFFIIYLTIALLLTLPGFMPQTTGSEPHTAMVKLNGTIMPGSKASSETVITGLRAAFESQNSKAVILKINSPGGSPVQSDEMFMAIRDLRAEFPDKKLYAVISDVGASGAYYVAAAADAIYANQSSLVGSIGVLYNGFGFVGAMDKLGVERRIYTAGKNKALMDPFSPIREDNEAFLKGLLADFHETFVSRVKEGRGDKLDSDNPDLFSGLAWSGKQAKELGLVDEFGTVKSVAREVVGEEKVLDYTVTENLFERISARASAQIKSTFLSIFDSRFV